MRAGREKLFMELSRKIMCKDRKPGSKAALAKI